jgi:signal transduction histidine kinase
VPGKCRAISKELTATAHKGSVAVHSESGRTTFMLSFRRKPEPAGQQAKPMS